MPFPAYRGVTPPPPPPTPGLLVSALTFCCCCCCWCAAIAVPRRARCADRDCARASGGGATARHWAAYPAATSGYRPQASARSWRGGRGGGAGWRGGREGTGWGGQRQVAGG